jgi:hypothetical protein
MSKYGAYVCVARAAWVETIGQWSKRLHGTGRGDGEEAKTVRAKEEVGEKHGGGLEQLEVGMVDESSK